MNAEQFYAEFKHALKSLGAEWGDMDKVKVSVNSDQDFRMEYAGRRFEFGMECDYE
jgi:hypothetical protein